jgi:hypothetical protein
MQDNDNPKTKNVCGVLFSRSVRSSFASLTLAPVTNQSQDDINAQPEPILVRLQFFDQVKELRSHCRKAYKVGDLLEIKEGSWQEIKDGANTEWKTRMVLNLSSIEQANKLVSVERSRFWSMTECQRWQNTFIPSKEPSVTRPVKSKPKKESQPRNQEDSHQCGSNHGGSLGKRLQGERIANFLVHCIMRKFSSAGDEMSNDPSEWSTMDGTKHATLRKRAVEYLNSGSGVVDVAGGSGHVSMALGMAGVKSTVVDTRPGVGKLPGRDRKIWNRAVKKGATQQASEEAALYCQPVIPFQTYRAWFGFRPEGVDSSYRHPDEEELPLCNETSDLLANASAIVALHPDEATGDIVRVAVSRRTPFVVVPCCVFCRLFPERRIPSNDQAVSSYDDLVEYLLGQDSLIEKAELPFQGKNTVLWSTF